MVGIGVDSGSRGINVVVYAAVVSFVVGNDDDDDGDDNDDGNENADVDVSDKDDILNIIFCYIRLSLLIQQQDVHHNHHIFTYVLTLQHTYSHI